MIGSGSVAKTREPSFTKSFDEGPTGRDEWKARLRTTFFSTLRLSSRKHKIYRVQPGVAAAKRIMRQDGSHG
jgi:hypothetical protein